MSLSTHVLDTTLGKPAAGLTVLLEVALDDDLAHFRPVTTRTTDADGRIADLVARGGLERATYRLDFATGPYFEARGQAVFYPHVSVVFRVLDPHAHHHVPLLLSPYGYSTYRGS
ncbi:MAG: hydroxyisourate hydrolase [Polyangiales bacterium]